MCGLEERDSWMKQGRLNMGRSEGDPFYILAGKKTAWTNDRYYPTAVVLLLAWVNIHNQTCNQICVLWDSHCDVSNHDRLIYWHETRVG